jgi:hypothetical protein
MKGITITGVLPDGSLDPDKTLTYVIGDLRDNNAPYLDEDGQPLASVTLRPMRREQVRRLQRKHTSKKPNGAGGLTEELDREAYLSDLVDLMIVDWSGLYTEAGDELQCTRKAKLSLGDERLTHMLGTATSNEVVDEAASFRQPASVS